MTKCLRTATFLCVFKKTEGAESHCQDSQELGFRSLLLPSSSDNNLVLITSPVSAVISSDILRALGNCLVQVTLEEASRLLLLNSLIPTLTTWLAVGRALGRLGAA